MNIKIDEQFKALIPPLAPEEYSQLEANILQDGCRDPLVTWRRIPSFAYCKECEKDQPCRLGDGNIECDVCEYGVGSCPDEILIDGHNRFEICRKHNIEFDTVGMEFESRAHARIWMRENQRGRRNLSPAWVIELELGNKADLLEIGRAKQVESGKQARAEQLGVVSQCDITPEKAPISTRAEIAKAAGVSTGQVGMAEQVKKKAPELWEKAKQGEVSISTAYKKIKKAEQLKERHEEYTKRTIEAAQQTPPTIANADCIEWLKSQPMTDLLITDPPYSTNVYDIEAFAKTWLPVALSKVKPTGRAYVCIGAYPEELAAYMKVAMPTQVLVWTYRNTLGPSPTHDYKLNWQAILYYRMPEAPPLDCPVMLEQFSVQEINAPDGRLGDRYHAWQKPMKLADQLIRHSTKEGDRVIDPFACTGTFLLSAAGMGRIAAGCDISNDNIKIAIERGCVDEC